MILQLVILRLVILRLVILRLVISGLVILRLVISGLVILRLVILRLVISGLVILRLVISGSVIGRSVSALPDAARRLSRCKARDMSGSMVAVEISANCFTRKWSMPSAISSIAMVKLRPNHRAPRR